MQLAEFAVGKKYPKICWLPHFSTSQLVNAVGSWKLKDKSFCRTGSNGDKPKARLMNI
jgi:hypothetical protein